MPTTPPAADAAGSPAPRSVHGTLFIVWLVVFIDLLGFGIVLPVMPRQAEPYLTELNLSPNARVLKREIAKKAAEATA